MRPRSIFATAAAAGVSLLLFGVAVPASATETADPFADARAGFTQLGLSSHESDLLLGKLTNGEPLDSMTDGAVPVRTDQYVQVGDAPYAGDGDQVTVKWFADGSPVVTSTEAPTEPAKNETARAIDGCTYTSGSGYSRAYGCTVTAWWGTIQIAFLADYTLVQGGPDYISDAYNGWQQCVYPTSCARPVEIQAKYTEGSGGDAFSRWGSTVSAPWGSWEVWVQIMVGQDRATFDSP